jgi:hypothetical protein
MNLTDKTVTIVYMSVTTFPPETTVKVDVGQEILTGIFKTLATYDLKFEQVYQNTSDPALLVAINEKLTLIPD